jgi:hypothetical protein
VEGNRLNGIAKNAAADAVAEGNTNARLRRRFPGDPDYDASSSVNHASGSQNVRTTHASDADIDAGASQEGKGAAVAAPAGEARPLIRNAAVGAREPVVRHNPAAG